MRASVVCVRACGGAAAAAAAGCVLWGGPEARDAHAHFAAAHMAMADCIPQAMKPARVMAASYAAILHKLEARGWDRLQMAVKVPKWRKLWIAFRYGML